MAVQTRVPSGRYCGDASGTLLDSRAIGKSPNGMRGPATPEEMSVALEGDLMTEAGLQDDTDAVSPTEEVEKFLCEECKGIPVPIDTKSSRVAQILRTLFGQVGYGWETPKVSNNVKSFHNVVARLLVDAEVDRAALEWPTLSRFATEDRCFSLSLLAGRCVLVVNVATQ